MVLGPSKSSVDAYNAKYSRLLGKIYIQSPAVDEILKSVPDDVKRADYTPKVARELQKKIEEVGGLTDRDLEGELKYFSFHESEDNKGVKRGYVKVGVATDVPNENGEAKPTMVFLSVHLNSDEGLMLVHKLVNAEFGENTKLSLFAKMGDPKEDWQRYADHIVGLSQNGAKVESVLPMTMGEIHAMQKRLKAAGKNKNYIKNALIMEEYKRTLQQIEIIQQKFENYCEERLAAGEEHGHGETEGEPRDPVMPNDTDENESIHGHQVPGYEMHFNDDRI